MSPAGESTRQLASYDSDPKHVKVHLAKDLAICQLREREGGVVGEPEAYGVPVVLAKVVLQPQHVLNTQYYSERPNQN